jgi:hypothetical protein
MMRQNIKILEEKMNAEETKPEEYRGGYYVTISYFIY